MVWLVLSILKFAQLVLVFNRNHQSSGLILPRRIEFSTGRAVSRNALRRLARVVRDENSSLG